MLKRFLNDIKKIFDTKFKLLCLGGIVLLPLVYSTIYLAAMWEPYSNLKNVPVAVVNDDKSSTIFNTEIDIGSELIKQLAVNRNMNWVFLNDYNEAKKGVYNGKYYMLIYVPNDFSKNIVSIIEGKPTKSNLVYLVNEKNNYLMSMISESAMKKIKDEIKAKIYDTVLKKVSAALKNYEQYFVGIEGSKELSEGTKSMYQGALILAKSMENFKNDLETSNKDYNKILNDIKASSENLYDKKLDFITQKDELKKELISRQNRILEVKSDVNEIKNNPQKYADDISLKFNNVVNESILSIPVVKMTKGDAKNISSNIASSIYDEEIKIIEGFINDINEKLKKISPFAYEYSKGPINNLENNLKEDAVQKDEVEKSILNVMNDVKGGTNDVSEKISENIYQSLSYSINKLNKNINKELMNSFSNMDLTKFNDDVDRLNKTISDSIDDLEGLNNSLVTAIDNSNNFINNNDNVLKNSINSLTDISNALSESTNGIAKGIGGFANATDVITKSVQKIDDAAGKLLNNSEGREDVIADPIDIKKEQMYNVNFYAQGLTPYFISLSLWVGSIAVFFVLKAKNVENVNLISKLFVIDIVSILQAIISCLVTQFVLKISIDNPFKFYLITIITALTFVTIVRGIMMLFPSMPQIGEFIAIILLMLQLTSCGGLYPIETSPIFFRIINKFLPMTYSVKAIKEAMFGAYGNIFLISMLVLVVYIAIFQTTTYVSSYKKYKLDWIKS